MAVNFKKLVKYYRRASGLYNKIVIIIFVIAAGLLLIYAMNPPAQGKLTVDESKLQEQTLIECAQTAENALKNDTLVAINTVTQISLINYDKEILVGQNQKNIIPPINGPYFTNYESLNSCFSDDRLVLAITVDNRTKLYPVALLEYHVVVNDIIGDTPVIIVHSPISGFYNVFKSTVKNDILIFGHSGALYKNTDLLVDFKSDSLWSVKDGRALVGMMTGATLEPVDFRMLNYGKAKKEFPDGIILSFVTGYRRSYGIDPFSTFKANNVIFQEPTYKSNAIKNKDVVLGLTVDNLHYAVAVDKISKTEAYKTKINDSDVKIVYDQGEYIVYLGKSPAIELKPIRALWYVWYDYYPDTRVI